MDITKESIAAACRHSLEQSLAAIQQRIDNLRQGAISTADNASSTSGEAQDDEYMIESQELEPNAMHFEQELGRVAEAEAAATDQHETIQLGSVVITDQLNLYVAASSNFEVAGTPFVGISTDAPIYAELAGRQAGDSVSFNGVTHQIRKVY